MGALKWAWVRIKPPGIGPQVLVHVSTYQGKPFRVHIFDPQPFANCQGTDHSAVEPHRAANDHTTASPKGSSSTNLWLGSMLTCVLLACPPGPPKDPCFQAWHRFCLGQRLPKNITPTKDAHLSWAKKVMFKAAKKGNIGTPVKGHKNGVFESRPNRLKGQRGGSSWDIWTGHALGHKCFR